MTMIETVLDVFNEIGSWISTELSSLMIVFYNSDSGLTFLGVLAVAGLGFSVIFLVLGIIQRFLHFRG